MRVFVFGPRILGVRPGVSFGPEDFRAVARAEATAANRAALWRLTLFIVGFCAFAAQLIFSHLNSPDAEFLFGGVVVGAAIFYGLMRLLFAPSH